MNYRNLICGFFLLLSTAAWSADVGARAITPRGALAADELTNISIFKETSPSVVHITTLSVGTNLFTFDTTQTQRGTGTGFIWDDKGHVVTNFHVIQGGNAARVTLADQSTWKATFVGAFPDRDLAVLKIDAPKDKLKAIALGESASLLVGQKVYAIGNPFGLDQTLTTGIVSALNREIQSVNQRTIHGVIQTDAAINPGNSGGPLIDSAGRLIGVNTAIFSPSGAYAGIGFAIPVDEVRRVVPRLIRDGKFTRPTIGVRSAPDDVRQALRLPAGIVIVGIDRNSPAERAGLRPFYRDRSGDIVAGDTIIAMAGTPVSNLDEMLNVLEKLQPGDKVKITLFRRGQKVEKVIMLGGAN